MTEPYERVISARDVPVLSGRIVLDQGGTSLVAEVCGGEATIELVEKFDNAVTSFGQTEPIRFVGLRRKLLLMVECELREMTITTVAHEPGNGEAATSPDSRRRS